MSDKLSSPTLFSCRSDSKQGKWQMEKERTQKVHPETFECRCRQDIFSSDTHHHLGTWLGRMFLKHIDLTTALRPSYLPDEVLLFVQDNVGLYEG